MRQGVRDLCRYPNSRVQVRVEDENENGNPKSVKNIWKCEGAQ